MYFTLITDTDTLYSSKGTFQIGACSKALKMGQALRLSGAPCTRLRDFIVVLNGAASLKRVVCAVCYMCYVCVYAKL